jgi:glutaredoxin
MLVSYGAARIRAVAELSVASADSETPAASLEPAVAPELGSYASRPEPHAEPASAPEQEPVATITLLGTPEARDQNDASELSDANVGRTQADVDRALRSTRVVMYATSSCPYCRKARQYFVRNGIPVQELDIDANRDAREELIGLTGQTSVPTIEIEGRLLAAGFSEDRITQALVSSVEQRLGIHGLELRRTE